MVLKKFGRHQVREKSTEECVEGPYKYNMWSVRHFNGEIIDQINVDWIEDNFQDILIHLVKLAHGYWVSIPLGAANDEEPPVNLVVTSVPLHHKQKELALCLVCGICSALHYMGYHEEERILIKKSKEMKKLPRETAISQIRQLFHSNFAPFQQIMVFNKPAHRNRPRQQMTVEQLVHHKTPFLTLVIPLGNDGSINHAISIVDDLIFDLSISSVMKLTRDSLDWICGDRGMCSLLEVYHFMPTKEYQNNFRKRKTNW